MWFLTRRPQKEHPENHEHSATVSGATTSALQSNYADPVRWMFLPSSKVIRANEEKPAQTETESAKFVRCVTMHRPTHESWREEKGAYPYAWHLKGRKRIWEVRIQVQFKRRPQKIHFGLELSRYVPLTRANRQLQKLLLSALRGCLGNALYHSPGDDPEKTEGEAEPPTFVMPLWAFDQFIVSEPGQEPDLCSDLSGFGFKRTDGLKKYVNEMDQTIANLSPDKVYTFSFWGISQFLDVIKWEIKGLTPFMKVDFNRFAGAPPVYVGMYEMPDDVTSKEVRHLLSRKKYFFRVALWSEDNPPPKQELEKMGALKALEEEEAQNNQQNPGRSSKKQKFSNVFACCTAREREDRDRLMGA
jgi:hypothetical protein